MGFAFELELVGPGSPGPKFLRSQKVFQTVVPDPKSALDPQDPTHRQAFYTDKFPVQSFLWGDYAALPGRTYRFRILPMFGTPGALTTDPKDEIKLEINTEEEWIPGQTTHGVWFNRGAIASQKFAEEFGNKSPADINDPKDHTVAWLSRGLLEACLNYINETQPGDALRVAAYEFTYPPILNTLTALIDKGIDVQIVYHDTVDPKTGKEGANEAAMRLAGLPINDQTVTYKRSKTKIPHNKFIVRLKGGTVPVEVWTGSTNFTPSGFLGQTNVGHRVADPATAQQYLDFWEVVKTDPDLKTARATLATLTPNPAEAIAKQSVVRLFSPRAKAEMLGWYGRRMLDCANSLWFTAAFGVSKDLIEPIARKRNQMRFVLMEKPAPDDQKKVLTADFNRVILSYGVPLGEIYRMKNGKPVARIPVKESELDKWFFNEEHFRAKNDGFVFFVHTKFLLIDPLSDDPLVCSGSANFSSGSLLQNDENMLLIRGRTRVADIYLTEFQRIFQHFYFRDIANELAAKGSKGAQGIFLDETDAWTNSYFKPRTLKNNRRLMFFEKPTSTWFANVAATPVAGPIKKKPAAKKTAATKKTPKKKTVRTKTKKAAPKKARKKTPTRKAAKVAKKVSKRRR
jgi:phosphatidylserine/phosphatidylglycerophosphate/cardiolipin synthase-like enzyme